MMATSYTKDDSQSNFPVFVHAALDDFGLTPVQFRVYCHVARRAGNAGVCFESIPKMSSFLELHVDTVRPALKFLLAHNILSAQERPGRSTEYRLTPIRDWKPLGKFQRGEIFGVVPSEKTRGVPLRKNRGLSISPEVSPQKFLPSESALRIFERYPVHDWKERGLRAIEDALKDYSFDFLFERTEQYARLCRGKDLQFVPHAVRWFSEKEFLTEPHSKIEKRTYNENSW